MADKEKLIWLLCNAHSKSCEASAFDGISYAEQLVIEADFLLENGITFAREDAVEVVHGRWLQSVPGYRVCSHCMADVAIYSDHKNYCPNCGAKMDGGTDND